MLNQAINQAIQSTQGAKDSDAGNIARNFGITEKGINQIFEKYGNDPRAKMFLNLMGTSPEKLKKDAQNILNMDTTPQQNSSVVNTNSSNVNKFPYLDSSNRSKTNTPTSNSRFPRL